MENDAWREGVQLLRNVIESAMKFLWGIHSTRAKRGRGKPKSQVQGGKPSANTPFVFQKELNFNLSSSFLKCAPHVSLLEDKAIAVQYQLSTIGSGNFKTILSRNLFCGSSVFCLVKISEPKIRRRWPPRVSAAFWGAFPGRIGEQSTADNVPDPVG